MSYKGALEATGVSRLCMPMAPGQKIPTHMTASAQGQLVSPPRSGALAHHLSAHHPVPSTYFSSRPQSFPIPSRPRAIPQAMDFFRIQVCVPTDSLCPLSV